MFIAIIPFIIAIVGVLMYALSTNVKLARIGEIMFFCGLLVTLFVAAKQTIALG